jgi:hypothetical protein
MGKVFEERLRMQRDARQLDEETVRLLQETYEERDLLHRMMQASLAETLLLDDQVMKGMPASEGVYPVPPGDGERDRQGARRAKEANGAEYSDCCCRCCRYCRCCCLRLRRRLCGCCGLRETTSDSELLGLARCSTC